jgi:hypothetical protein
MMALGWILRVKLFALSVSMGTIANYSRLNLLPRMQAYYPRFWLILYTFTCLKTGHAAEETVDVVDFSDLAIYDAFNNSYLAVFSGDYIYSGNFANSKTWHVHCIEIIVGGSGPF